MRIPFLPLGLAAFVLFSSGCSTFKYLSQAASGQMDLWLRARPIEEVIEDPSTPPKLAFLLSQVPDIKKFGDDAGLKPTTNYQEYVALERDAVVTVVSASQPLQFEPKTWSFPMVGSFTYLGWFNSEAAQSFASDLEKEGWDVHVRGAQAYSTLGWFDDPILSTMIESESIALPALVNVVLHESVHATLYIKGQSAFNESLAEFLATVLTARYFTEKDQSNSQDYQQYLEYEQRRDHRQKTLNEAYLSLEKVYQSQMSSQDKLSQKQKIMDEIESSLRLSIKPNNAFLIQFKTYHSSSEAWELTLQHCQSNVSRFIEHLKTLKTQDFKETQSNDFEDTLSRLRQRPC